MGMVLARGEMLKVLQAKRVAQIRKSAPESEEPWLHQSIRECWRYYLGYLAVFRVHLRGLTLFLVSFSAFKRVLVTNLLSVLSQAVLWAEAKGCHLRFDSSSYYSDCPAQSSLVRPPRLQGLEVRCRRYLAVADSYRPAYFRTHHVSGSLLIIRYGQLCSMRVAWLSLPWRFRERDSIPMRSSFRESCVFWLPLHREIQRIG